MTHSPLSSSRPAIILLAALAISWSGCTEDGPLFPANEPPSADAGSDRLVEAGEQAQLDGRKSADEDGEDLDYAWALVSGPAWVAIADADSPQAQIVPQVPGEYIFRLTVADEAGATGRDDVRILVTSQAPIPINTAPTADAGSDGTTSVGLEIILDGSSSSDPDGDDLVFAWVQISGPAVAIVEGDRHRARVIPPEMGDYVFRLTVIDAQGGSAQDEVHVSAAQVVDLLQRVDSAAVGAVYDSGNSIPFYQDPVEEARLLAPWVRTTHIKDHILVKDGESTWSVGTALGQGRIPLAEIIDVLRTAPHISRLMTQVTYGYAVRLPVAPRDIPSISLYEPVDRPADDLGIWVPSRDAEHGYLTPSEEQLDTAARHVETSVTFMNDLLAS